MRVQAFASTIAVLSLSLGTIGCKGHYAVVHEWPPLGPWPAIRPLIETWCPTANASEDDDSWRCQASVGAGVERLVSVHLDKARLPPQVTAVWLEFSWSAEAARPGECDHLADELAPYASLLRPDDPELLEKATAVPTTWRDHEGPVARLGPRSWVSVGYTEFEQSCRIQIWSWAQ